jgi:hypothetical protein
VQRLVLPIPAVPDHHRLDSSVTPNFAGAGCPSCMVNQYWEDAYTRLSPRIAGTGNAVLIVPFHSIPKRYFLAATRTIASARAPRAPWR